MQFGIHLSTLTRAQYISIPSSMLSPVPIVMPGLRSQLAEADVIDLPVGPSPLQSERRPCLGDHLTLARYYRGEASVLPVLLQMPLRAAVAFFALGRSCKENAQSGTAPDPDRAGGCRSEIQFALSSLSKLASAEMPL